MVARPAARAIAETLPDAVSAAVIDFITRSFIDNPRRGRPRTRETNSPASTAPAAGATGSCIESMSTNEQSRCFVSTTEAASTEPRETRLRCRPSGAVVGSGVARPADVRSCRRGATGRSSDLGGQCFGLDCALAGGLRRLPRSPEHPCLLRTAPVGGRCAPSTSAAVRATTLGSWQGRAPRWSPSTSPSGSFVLQRIVPCPASTTSWETEPSCRSCRTPSTPSQRS